MLTGAEYSASTFTIWKNYEFASLPLREPTFCSPASTHPTFLFAPKNCSGDPSDCGEQIRTMFTGAELVCIDITIWKNYEFASPAPRTTHLLSRQHPSNISFRTERFLGDVSTVENK